MRAVAKRSRSRVVLAALFAGHLAPTARAQGAPCEFVAAVAERGFTAALAADGRVWAWGQGPCWDWFPQPIAGLDEVVQIAGFDDHLLFVRRDGTVWGQGNNDRGETYGPPGSRDCTPAPVPGLQDVVQVSTSFFYSLAVRRDGSVWFWGDRTGQNPPDLTPPIPIEFLSNIVAAEAEWFHAVLLDRDGRVFQWAPPFDLPEQVRGLDPIRAITAESGSRLAIAIDGTVWAWGENGYGQLGVGSRVRVLAPVKVPAFGHAVAVYLGELDSMVIRDDGKVLMAGSGRDGVLGTAGGNGLTPVEVAGIDGAVAGAASRSNGEIRMDSHAVAVTAGGTVESWGDNHYRQLGLATDPQWPFFSATPVTPAIDRTLRPIDHLRAVRSGSDVVLRHSGSWSMGSYRVERGPAPDAFAPLGPDSSATEVTDPGAVSIPGMLFYRVRAVSCSGMVSE